jgi:hypothetical protein
MSILTINFFPDFSIQNFSSGYLNSAVVEKGTRAAVACDNFAFNVSSITVSNIVN